MCSSQCRYCRGYAIASVLQEGPTEGQTPSTDVRSTADVHSTTRAVPLEHLFTDSEPRLWAHSTVAELFGRCGVGSRRERVRAAPGLIVRLVTSCPCSEALLDNEDGILLSHSIRVHMRLVMSQKSAEVFIDEWKDVAFLDIGSVQIECWLQEVFVTSACSIIAM